MREYMLLFISLLAFVKLCTSASTGDCSIQYDIGVTAEHHHPMIIRADGEGFQYPVMDGNVRILRISHGKGVLVTCPGHQNSLLLNSRPRTYIKCTKKRLYDGNQVVTWPQLGCKDKPRPNLDRQEGTCGASKKGRIYTIHWPIRRGVDIQQIYICFDEEKEEALFTYHQIPGKHTNAKIKESSRPSFKKTDMITIRADSVYAIKAQKALFKQLLKSGRHLTGVREHYLARGHLAPDSDFVLEAEQDATYYYANAVPQWQAVNNGNWKSLENSVRELAEKRGTVLEVWTGVHGILNLPDTRKNPVELFLGLGVGKRVIPVPAFIWKVIHDPSKHEAIAVVQVNDIGGLGLANNLNLYESPCNDLCAHISWVDWDVLDHTSGRTFCCSIQDLRTSIHSIPDLKSVNILSSI